VARKRLQVAVDLETGGPFFKSKSDVQNAWRRFCLHNRPAYLKVNGKPVVFFWQNSRYSVNDWMTIRQAVDPHINRSGLVKAPTSTICASLTGIISTTSPGRLIRAPR
jgi:hypothetical protein